jgi:hypothetical protein
MSRSYTSSPPWRLVVGSETTDLLLLFCPLISALCDFVDLPLVCVSEVRLSSLLLISIHRGSAVKSVIYILVQTTHRSPYYDILTL